VRRARLAEVDAAVLDVVGLHSAGATGEPGEPTGRG